jgi:hypothetical protein
MRRHAAKASLRPGAQRLAVLIGTLHAAPMMMSLASPIKWTHTCSRLTRTCACFRVNDRMIAVIVLPHNTRVSVSTYTHAHSYTHSGGYARRYWRPRSDYNYE